MEMSWYLYNFFLPFEFFIAMISFQPVCSRNDGNSRIASNWTPSTWIQCAAYGAYQAYIYVNYVERRKRHFYGVVSCWVPLDIQRKSNLFTKKSVRTYQNMVDIYFGMYSIWRELLLDHVNHDHMLTFVTVFVLYSYCICIIFTMYLYNEAQLFFWKLDHVNHVLTFPLKGSTFAAILDLLLILLRTSTLNISNWKFISSGWI